MPTYARANIAFVKGEGAYAFDEAGRRYLDFGSGVAVNALGHAHPALVKALTEQAAKIWHTSNLYRVVGQERVSQMLVERTFADTVFFCNSGAEANEACIKMVRKYHDETGNPDRYRVIACGGAFHGRTMATIAAGGQEKHLQGFLPAVEGFDHVAFGNLNELRAAITPETAAILVEPIQGEGGIRTSTIDYLRGLRTVADEFGLLLVFDEVQTGIGRTGKLFAYEWSGVTPDVMAVAKGLGGGFPVGACLATERAAVGMKPGTHGSTFGGNPLAMAVAEAVLTELDKPGFLEHVRQIGDYLWGRLEALVDKHPKVLAELRGSGLMLGLRTHPVNSEVVAKLLANGLLTVGAGDNVVRLLPPLIIGKAEADEALAILDRTCSELAS